MEHPDIRTVMKYEFLCGTSALQTTQNTNKLFGCYCYYATDNMNVVRKILYRSSNFNAFEFDFFSNSERKLNFTSI